MFSMWGNLSIIKSIICYLNLNYKLAPFTPFLALYSQFFFTILLFSHSNLKHKMVGVGTMYMTIKESARKILMLFISYFHIFGGSDHEKSLYPLAD